MKKSRLIAIVLSLILCISTTKVCYAAEDSHNIKHDVIDSNTIDATLDSDTTEKLLTPDRLSAGHGTGTLYGHNWGVVAQRSSSLNQWIRLEVTTTVDCDVDVRMKNKNGVVIWSENAAFRADNDRWRKFWCGSNVYTVEARLSTGNPFVNINSVNAIWTTYYNVTAP